MRLGLGVGLPMPSGVGVARFSPLDLEPVLWLDASAESSITAADGAWLDGSGLVLPGLAGNYASTPDSAALSITGDIDIKVKVALDDWSPGTIQTLLGKYVTTGDQRSLWFHVETSGKLVFLWSEDGTNGTIQSAQSSVAVGVADGVAKWIRVTMDVDNGASNRATKFYTSDDGETWSQLGSTVAGSTTSIYDSTTPLTIGTYAFDFSQQLNGTVYRVIIQDAFDTADNTTNVVFDADFTAEAAGTLSFTEDSTNAATVTLTTTYGQVSQWDDLSGSGNDVVQATAAAQPKSGRRALNGLNVLDFDGTDEVRNTGISLSATAVLFIVSDDDAISGAARDLIAGLTANVPSIGFLGGSSYRIFQGSGLSGGTAATGAKLWKVVLGSTDTLHINGISILSGNAGSSTTTGIAVGGVTYKIDGAIAEVVIVDGTLTADQIAATEEYLAQKWGIYTAPDQITDLTAYPDNGSVDLTWTAPADNGLTITDYLVQYSTDGTSWTTVETSSTSLTVSGLSNGVEYDFRVAAKNAAGVGTVSSVVSVSPFDVLSLSPVLWLDASDAASITESGGAVSQWDDLSGNGYDVVQATAANQPITGTRTLNGLNVLDFTPTQTIGVNSGLTMTQPNTIIAVGKFDSITSYDYWVDGWLSTDRHRVGSTASTNVAMATGTGDLISSVPFSTTDPQLVVATFDTTSSVLRVDGAVEATGNAGSSDFVPIVIGGAYGNSSGNLNGIIAEVIVIDGTLTADQITATEQYLAQKWGITL